MPSTLSLAPSVSSASSNGRDILERRLYTTDIRYSHQPLVEFEVDRTTSDSTPWRILVDGCTFVHPDLNELLVLAFVVGLRRLSETQLKMILMDFREFSA